MFKYFIEDYELSHSYFGEDHYSYRLDSRGNNADELLGNAKVTAVDSFGIELWADHISDCNNETIEYVERIIKKVINK